ncbi:YeeE/YedE family protein [Actibacterium pelagium]|uniref:Sulphur transport domain-containing protein n=1 Tax=Actibacterium pelagium TaxID=2029103 RepID=A0A917EKC0_9RHOB|nr:YeeE/YedE family protein [Actibacterium pelagium]GGE56618.1 hypothetical protein GCM10011517_25480 [Actibacterium pelagium]
MFDLANEGFVVLLIGLAGGILLGLAARLGRFCTLGALEDVLYSHNDIRLRMWAVAIGVAMIGVHVLVGLGIIDLSAVGILSDKWNPVASIVGGLLFGYGMALSGNCGYGALARLGGGDLRSFVIVLVMGLAAYATLSGPLAYLRIWVFPQVQAEATPSLSVLAEQSFSLPAGMAGIVIGLVILGFAVAPKRMREDRPAMFWGAVVGLAVMAGWGGTAWVAHTSLGAVSVQSHTFSAPVGEAMLYAMTASGQTLSFGLGSVAGVWIGAFIGSLIKGHFRWEACEDPRELKRQIFGAGMMGVGAVIAVGCSIGQGLSAMAVLSYGAPVTLISIVLGAAFGLRQLIEGFHQPAE